MGVMDMSTSCSTDSFTLDGVEYVVIDISEYAHPILCADFIMPCEFQYNPGTNNRRGYVADYELIDNKLYGTKVIYLGGEPVSSKKLFVDFTGAFVIAFISHSGRYGGLYCGVEYYIYFDRAFELIFQNGILIEKRDLSAAKIEFEQLVNSKRYGSGFIEAHRIKIARKHLKYSYHSHQYTHRETSMLVMNQLDLMDDCYDR